MTQLIASNKAGLNGGPLTALKHWRPSLTRRDVQIALGVIWLLDGFLQLQPFMFTAAFAQQVLAPAGVGQPSWVGGPIDFFARIIAVHAAPLDAGFALIQLTLGVGFLFPRLVRPAIMGSVAWSAALWWVSEGVGGLAGGHASMVTGAPGAVILYAVLAMAAWPVHDEHKTGQASVAVAGWLRPVWAVLWLSGALLQVLPGQSGTAALRDQIGATDGVPGWLAGLHHDADATLSHGGNAPFVALVAVMVLVGLAALGPRRWRLGAAAVGFVVAAGFWVLGQNIGQLYSGQATDPNTGLLIMLMAAALAGTAIPRRQPNKPDAIATVAGELAGTTASQTYGLRRIPRG